MAGHCCKDTGGDSHTQTTHETPGSPDSATVQKDDDKEAGNGCCEDSVCGCDDNCFDELARVICADDETHLHDTTSEVANKSNGSLSGCGNSNESACTLCAENETNTTDVKELDPSTKNGGGCEHHTRCKEAVTKDPSSHSSYPKHACGEHRTIARSRYNDTLAAFGCVCKALLARGLKSCCTSTALRGKSIARSISNRRSAPSVRSGHHGKKSRSTSVDSCCDKGECRAPSIRTVPRGHADTKSLASHKSGFCASLDSCCRGGCCGEGSCADDDDDPKAQTRVSIDSCCRGGGSCAGDNHDEKSEHIVLDMAEKDGGKLVEHAVIAVKGMTCTGCENKLIRTLRGIPVVRNIKTSLVLCRAEFDFDSGSTEVESLVALIEKRSGFSAEIIKAGSTRDLLLTVARPVHEKFMNSARPLGVDSVVRSGKDSLLVTYDPAIIGARKVLESYEAFTPVLAPEPPDPAIMAGVKHIRSLALRTVLSAALTIPVLVMTWAPLPPHHRAYAIASLVLATIVQTVITGPFYVSSFKSLVFSRLVETELLIVLSTTTAYVYSVVAFAYDMIGRPLATGQFFETSTLLVTLIMVGQLISAIARQRAIEAISIRSLQERTARIVFASGREEVLDVRLMHHGDTFKVLPDSAIITDGEVVSGTSTVDESMMTGESLPVEKAVGSTVIAGTLNGPSTLLIKATRLPGENTISDIAGMVDSARFSRARVQEAVDWVCARFVPVVLVLALITFVVWLAIGLAVRHQPGGEAAVTALTYAISVLAISCPCAIGLAVPMVILVAGGVGAKLGLVFKAATTIEHARKVTHVVFDKTGTLTQGKLAVASRFVDADAGFDVPAAVAQLVSVSRHPVARAVAAALASESKAESEATPPLQPHPTVSVEDIEQVVGKGVQGTLLGQPLRGGSASWLGLDPTTNATIAPLIAQGLTLFCVTHGPRLIAAFGLADTLRPEAQDVLHALAARGLGISILSGDHPDAVRATARALGVPMESVRAGCLPGDKQAYVQELAERGERVLFCGDGTNDAVALAQAAVGVHLQGAGEGEGAGVAAAAAADVVLTHPSLVGVLTLLELSDAVARRVAANFVWAGVYNLVAVLFAAGAFVDVRVAPAYAGLGEVVSVLPVVLVAVQLKWFKPSV